MKDNMIMCVLQDQINNSINIRDVQRRHIMEPNKNMTRQYLTVQPYNSSLCCQISNQLFEGQRTVKGLRECCRKKVLYSNTNNTFVYRTFVYTYKMLLIVSTLMTTIHSASYPDFLLIYLFILLIISMHMLYVLYCYHYTVF